MAVYDGYDAAKAHLRTRRCDPRAVAPLDLHTATLCRAMIVLADGFQTGLYYVTVAMNAGLLFRLNHLIWVVEDLTGRDLVIIADTVAKVNSQFSLVRVDGRK